MKETSCREAVAQAPDQDIGEAALLRPDGCSIPLGRLEIVNRNEGRLAAHGQAHIPFGKGRIHLFSDRVQRMPGFLRKRLGDARMLRNARDRHIEGEIDLRGADRGKAARNRSSIPVMRACGQRDMALARQKPGCGVKANPARSRKIDLDPGMQVGEIMVRSRRPVEGDEIGFELNEIAGDETRGKTQMPEDFDQQPGGIPAGAARFLEGFLRFLDAGFHADQVFGLVCDPAVQVDDEINGVARCAVNRFQEGAYARRRADRFAIDRQILSQVLRVVEGPLFRTFLDKEIEGIVDRHVCGQVHLDPEFPHRVREHEPRQPVAIGVLLMVDEIAFRRNLQRMCDDAGSAVGRRSQPDRLRSQCNRAIISVMREMIDGCLD